MMIMIMIRTTTTTTSTTIIIIIIIIFYGYYIKLYICILLCIIYDDPEDICIRQMQSLKNHNYRTHHTWPWTWPGAYFLRYQIL